jgi:nucleotidyltransferase/DNA polymerase involved in DNA repair
MRIACVLIPHFPVAVERRRDPALRSRPVVIGETPDQRKAVLDCAPEAEAQGVRVGMPLRQAVALCRDAVFLPPHPSRYGDVFESVLDALDGFSPKVEESTLGRAYLNAEGLALHYEGELDMGERMIRSVRDATGLVASAGIAEGKSVAWTAAVTSEPGQVCTVPAGKGAEFLQFLHPLDVSLLPAAPDTLRRLELYGLHIMGDLAALPVGPLQAQFGAEGKRLWELAQGTDREPLRPRHKEEVIVEGLRFPAAAVSVEALVVACRRLLVRLNSFQAR